MHKAKRIWYPVTYEAGAIATVLPYLANRGLGEFSISEPFVFVDCGYIAASITGFGNTSWDIQGGANPDNYRLMGDGVPRSMVSSIHMLDWSEYELQAGVYQVRHNIVGPFPSDAYKGYVDILILDKNLNETN